MKVVFTEQSIERLETSLKFYLEELKIPKDQVIKIKNEVLNRAKSLSKSPFKGQYEPYLVKLNQGHRRLVEGNFKIVYRIQNKTIYIVDFFDSREDPNKMKG